MAIRDKERRPTALQNKVRGPRAIRHKERRPTALRDKAKGLTAIHDEVRGPTAIQDKLRDPTATQDKVTGLSRSMWEDLMAIQVNTRRVPAAVLDKARTEQLVAGFWHTVDRTRSPQFSYYAKPFL